MHRIETLYTLGHSNHPIERFVALLRQHGITAIADVRSTPYSRFHPQFNRKTLAESLAREGIEYQYFGDALGARTADRACYEGGRVSYAKLAATENFRAGLERLLTAAGTHRVALMCAEKEPLDCHRTILIARQLCRHGVAVAHILETGVLESQEDALARLRVKLKMPTEDLFGAEDVLNEEAYEAQGRRIAYSPHSPPAHNVY